MQLEVGSVLEGKVTRVKDFGAFVKLPDGTNGMVHISEVSNEYIQELSEVLSEGQTVNVKVMSISPEGKVALSIKRTQEQPEGSASQRSVPQRGNRNNDRNSDAPRQNRGAKPQQRSSRQSDPGKVWQPRQQASQTGEMSFEDMMSKFKTQSEEKISDLKKVTEAHRGGGYSRRK